MLSEKGEEINSVVWFQFCVKREVEQFFKELIQKETQT